MTVGTYLTAQGLNIPTVEQILAACSAEQRSTIDSLLNTDADGPVGQLSGIFASHLREAWEALQIAYNGENPDAAEGFLLEAVSAITGTLRAPATRSKFVGARKLRMTLGATTPVPAGTTFHVLGDPNTSFHTTEDITSTIAGDYLVSAECDVTGPVPCNATTLTEISTPVVGLNAVINDFDAIPGTNADNDAELRIRREQELRATGSGTIDSIRADLLGIALEDESKPIQEAIILENVNDTTDGNGLPGHSIECLVYDGVGQDCPDDTIAQTIWNSKPAGIQLYGGLTGNAVDSLGNSRIVPFSRPTSKEVVLLATLTLANPNQVPSQYLAVVRAAVIAEFAKRVRVGSVIRCNHYEAAILAIPGIDDAIVQLAFNPPGTLNPAGTNLTLGVREIGYIQTSGISVA
jgi:hypothetical protein